MLVGNKQIKHEETVLAINGREACRRDNDIRKQMNEKKKNK